MQAMENKFKTKQNSIAYTVVISHLISFFYLSCPETCMFKNSGKLNVKLQM